MLCNNFRSRGNRTHVESDLAVRKEGKETGRQTTLRHLVSRPLTLLLAGSLGLLSFVGLFMLSAGNHAAAANTLCVRPGGGGGCLSTIAEALSAAQEADTIRVAAGTYTENVTISQTLTLEGGWRPDFAIRDVGRFSTTIRPGDPTQSVVSIRGAINAPITPTMDGFIITGGRADLGFNHGGGLSIRDSNAILRNNIISGNVAYFLGGGIWVQRGAPLLESNRIENNLSTGFGGGLELEQSQAVLVDNQIISNTATGIDAYGGGIDVTGGLVQLLGNRIISNHVNPSSMVAGFGGGVALRGGSAVFSGTLIQGNSASNNGGGIWNSGHISISYGTIALNHAGIEGGGIYNSHYFSMTSSVVLQNQSVGNGGGVFNTADFTSRRSLFTLNSATTGGGLDNSGAFLITNSTLSHNSAATKGGGLFNQGGVRLNNVTVFSNTAPFASGMANNNFAWVVNSIIAGDAGNNCSGNLDSQSHNNIEDGGNCGMNPGTNFPNTDPALRPLQMPGMNVPLYGLKQGSPAIDAGDNANCPTVDQRGLPRPIDGDRDGEAVCDVGAIEFWPRVYLPAVMN